MAGAGLSGVGREVQGHSPSTLDCSVLAAPSKYSEEPLGLLTGKREGERPNRDRVEGKGQGQEKKGEGREN